MKNIQRRRSTQSQQTASYLGPFTDGKSGLESEVERLRREKSSLMQEVFELQHQQRGTARLMEGVNKRLQSAEQKQKQMVSFFSKMVQNPSFIAKLKQKVEQKNIGSPRTRKKFITQQPSGVTDPDPSFKGQLVKYGSGLENFNMLSDMDEGMVGKLVFDELNTQYQSEDVVSDELIVSDEIVALQGFTTDQVGGGASRIGAGDPLFKGKGVMSPQQEVNFGLNPEYYVCFPEDPTKEMTFPELSSTGMESIIKQENTWNTSFDSSAGMSSGGNEFLDTQVGYETPELGMMPGMLDFWDFDSSQVVGGSEHEKWTTDVSPFGHNPENQASPP